MTGAVRTVLGDIAPSELGLCDAHDHLFMASAKLPGQELDDAEAAAGELGLYQRLGGGAVVQWTPYGLGRRAGELAGLSRATGVHIVAATGLHQAEHYGPGVVDGVRDRLTELFVGELTGGMDAGLAPRAGMIKVAGGFHALNGHARHVMTSAAGAHLATGAPIGVHLEHGTAGPDVLDLLCGELGVPPRRVILGHLNRHPDAHALHDLAEAGAFLAFDGPSPANHATDWRLLDALVALAEAGHAGRILLGGDTTTVAARASTGGGPGMPFLLRRLRPRLVRHLGEDATRRILVDNPARAFAAEWPVTREMTT